MYGQLTSYSGSSLPVPNREEPEYEAMASTNENSDLNAGGLDAGKQI